MKRREIDIFRVMNENLFETMLTGGVSFGDKVTLAGRDGDERLPVEILSELSGKFNYEFICSLGKRIPRTFLRHGRVTEQMDYFE